MKNSITGYLNKKTDPELFSVMAQTANDLGIKFSQSITIYKLAMLIEETLSTVCTVDNYPQAA